MFWQASRTVVNGLWWLGILLRRVFFVVFMMLTKLGHHGLIIRVDKQRSGSC